MRSLISAGFLGLLGLAATTRAAVSDLWPVQLPPPVDAAGFTRKADALDAVTGFPPELAPTIQFEKAFYKAVSRAAQGEWLPQMRAFAAATGNDPVAAGLRDVSRAWVARIEMQSIDVALTDYYAQNVRFPLSFGEVEKSLSPDLRVDPWGQPWIYRPHAPTGFSKESRQRYQLGPTRLPDLGTLREATTDRKPFAPPAWKVALRVVGENRALEFQADGTVVGLISAGGTLGVYSLMYVADHWALMAGPDQLFTVAF